MKSLTPSVGFHSKSYQYQLSQKIVAVKRKIFFSIHPKYYKAFPKQLLKKPTDTNLILL